MPRKPAQKLAWCEPPSVDECHLAALQCAANAIGDTPEARLADAELLMRALGVFPGEEERDIPTRVMAIGINNTSPATPHRRRPMKAMNTR